MRSIPRYKIRWKSTNGTIHRLRTDSTRVMLAKAQSLRLTGLRFKVVDRHGHD